MSSTWYVDRTPDGDNEGIYDQEQHDAERATRDASYGSLHGNGCGCAACDPVPDDEDDQEEAQRYADSYNDTR